MPLSIEILRSALSLKNTETQKIVKTIPLKIQVAVLLPLSPSISPLAISSATKVAGTAAKNRSMPVLIIPFFLA